VEQWPGTNTPVWIKLVANPDPNSNEIMLVAADMNYSLYGAIWNGNVSSFTAQITFANASLPNVCISTAINQQTFDAAYTYGTNGTNYMGLVLYSTGTGVTVGDGQPSEQLKYAIWYSSSSSWSVVINKGPNLNDTAGQDNTARWIKLASDRSTQRIAWGANDNYLDLHAGIFDGATQTFNYQTNITTHAVAPNWTDTSVALDYRTFDLAWEGSGSRLLVAFANSGSASLYHKVFQTSNNGWVSTAIADASAGNAIRNVQLTADPNDPSTNEMFAAITTSIGQQRIYHWSAPPTAPSRFPATHVAPPSAWVKPQFFNRQASPNSLESSADEYLLLQERQINVPLGETFHHSVRQILTTAGVQKGATITIDFNPGYQSLTWHWARIWRGAEHLERLDTNEVKVVQPEREVDQWAAGIAARTPGETPRHQALAGSRIIPAGLSRRRSVSFVNHVRTAHRCRVVAYSAVP